MVVCSPSAAPRSWFGHQRFPRLTNVGRRTHLTGDDDYEPTYRWALLIIAATMVCMALGALAMLGAISITN